MLAGSRIIITLPDGTKEGFTFSPVKTNISAYGTGFSETYRPGFIPDPGNTSGLYVKQGFTLVKYGSGSEYVSLTQDATLNLSYNPANPAFGGYFEVQLRDGTVYGMDITGRTEDVWVEDRNKNRVTYSRNRITHSNGRVVTIQRTGDRINSITDPAGYSTQYGYDGLGNLISVTDRSNRTTQFSYDDSQFVHHITGVIDALNRTALANDYDSDGRLETLTDAASESAGIGLSPDLRTQETLDDDGNVISTITFDHRGNVIREEGPGERLIVRRFTEDRVDRETQVVGQLDSTENGETDDLVTQYQYNAKGELETSTDSRGNSQRVGYTSTGSVDWSADPLGNQTNYLYDDRGNIEEVVTSTSRQKLGYDTDGNVTQVYRYLDGEYLLSVTNKYDSFGQLERVENEYGSITTFQYDAVGRQTHVFRTELDQDGTELHFTDVTQYDPEGRAYLSQRQVQRGDGPVLTLSSQETFYDALGQVERVEEIRGDADPRITWNTYDIRGLSIQTRTNSRGSNPLNPSEISESFSVSRSYYDEDGRSILSTQFVEDPATVSGQFDNATSNDVSYTHYDIQGRVDATYRLAGVKIIITGTPANLTSHLDVGGIVYDEAVHGSLDDWLLSHATILSKTATQYDALGRVSSQVNQYGLRTQTTYNQHGDTTESRSEVSLSGDFQRPAGTESVWMVSRTVYDDFGRSVCSTNSYLVFVDAAGNETIGSEVTATYSHYDGLGRAWKTEQLSDVVVSIDSKGQTTLEPGSTVVSWSETRFDDQGRTIQSISSSGLVTDYEFDSQGRQWASAGLRQLARDVAGLSQQDFSSDEYVRSRTETLYDGNGQASRTVSNLIQVESSDGTVLRVIRDQERWSEATLDGFGNAVRTTFNDDSYIEYRFNDFGEQIAESQQIDGRYVTTWSESDESFVIVGWEGITQLSPPTGFMQLGQSVPTRLMSYDSLGRLQSVALPAADDGSGQLVRPTYLYGYDSFGNQNLIVDPLGHETRFTFDNDGRQLTRTLPLGFGDDGQLGTPDDLPGLPSNQSWGDGYYTESFRYDDLGRQYLHISFEGIVTEQIFDDPTVPALPDGSSTGRMIELRYYDSIADYDNGTLRETWTYTYDAWGRQRTATHSTIDGSTTTEDRVETNTFDEQGRLWVVQTPEGTLEYRYDDQGRKTDTIVRSANADVPSDSSLAWQTPAERITSYTYDAFGRLKTVVEDSDPSDATNETLDTQYGYTFSGSLGRTSLPNGVTQNYAYDSLGRLDVMHDSYVVETSGETLELARYDYSVRADGKRTGLVESFWFDANADGIRDVDEVKTTSYDWIYDHVGRLTQETVDHWDESFDQTESFAYDLTGNRTSLTRVPSAIGSPLPDQGEGPGVRVDYEYDANDRLFAEFSDDRSLADNDTFTEYDYDHTQQTRKTVHTGAETSGPRFSQQLFGYNLQGRMASVINDTFDGTGTLTARERTRYEYDAKSFRVSLVTEDGTSLSADPNTEVWSLKSETSFLADHHNHTGYTQTIREMTTNADGSTKTIDYTFGQDEIAQRVRTDDGQGNTTDETLIFGHDGHGSVRVLYDAAAAIAQVFTFAAYGEMIALHNEAAASIAVSARLSSLGYSGEHFDAKAAQQYLRARFYNPANGRFNRLDPFAGNMQDPQSLHKYAYVHGDPILGVDSNGEYTIASSLSGMTIQAGMSNALNDASMAAYSAAVGAKSSQSIGEFVQVFDEKFNEALEGSFYSLLPFLGTLYDLYKFGEAAFSFIGSVIDRTGTNSGTNSNTFTHRLTPAVFGQVAPGIRGWTASRYFTKYRPGMVMDSVKRIKDGIVDYVPLIGSPQGTTRLGAPTAHAQEVKRLAVAIAEHADTELVAMNRSLSTTLRDIAGTYSPWAKKLGVNLYIPVNYKSLTNQLDRYSPDVIAIQGDLLILQEVASPMQMARHGVDPDYIKWLAAVKQVASDSSLRVRIEVYDTAGNLAKVL
ncbi:RHS repeat-associated core domain-containing protein [Stieleria varia]|uniref:tRNA3(Ser)-specific nuclease WapA n=2 Tax=Stieleria varia TaxID=2528005 RepID=A0A5C6A0B2_9BACT|nr:tRNA3(Ser)-specific nuclease WapA precursor [Stieleria varia]